MRLIISVLFLTVISFACSCSPDEIDKDPSPDENNSSDDDRVLYNGIVLPNEWPPRTGDPYSSQPMVTPYLDNPPSVIPIDVGRQLFVDDFLVKETNLRRVFHQAEKYEGNPVIDQAGFRQGGVFYDFDKRQFVASYRREPAGGVQNPLTFASSNNLIDWQEISSPFAPIASPNAFWLHFDSNTLETAWYMMGVDRVEPRPSDDPNVPFINALWENTMHKSSDGQTWYNGVPLGRSNDYSSFFYNPFREVWVMSVKHNVPRVGRTLYRSRYYAERNSIESSGSFHDAVFWINADVQDEPHPEVGDEAQLYSLHGVAYESLILGSFQIHLGPTNEIASERGVPKYNEIKLGFSRDGFHWDRPDRTSFIKGTYNEGDWDRAFINIPQGGVLVVGDKLWFPYNAYSGIAPNGSEGMYNGAGIGLATLRRDGFASMEAESATGTLLTRPLTFSGKHLFVNVDCPGGELRVEVLNEDGEVIEGLNAEACESVRTDATLHKVSWASVEDLSGLEEQPVQFRFHLTNGKLYSFWVSPDENGASYGYLGAGGSGHESIVDSKGIEAY